MSYSVKKYLEPALPAIARAYFLHRKGDLSSLPAWLQDHFEGASIQDFLDHNITNIFTHSLNDTNHCILMDKNINSLQGLENIPGISSARGISIYFPRMKEIRLGTFDMFPALTALSIQGSRVTEIKAGLFKSLKNLVLLDLSNNAIEGFQPNTFEGLGNLKQLGLNKNNIKSYTKEAFAGLAYFTKIFVDVAPNVPALTVPTKKLTGEGVYLDRSLLE